MSSNIKVAIRIRPLIPREKNEKLKEQWEVSNNSIYSIDINTGKRIGDAYHFDHIFDHDCDNSKIYNKVVHPVVEQAMNGFNGTVFVYGQTSSGKTYTMMGTSKTDGLISLAVQNIFQSIEQSINRKFLLRVSYMQIYNEKIYDLLDVKNIVKISEDLSGSVIVNVREEVADSVEKILDMLRLGDKSRKIGETNLNEKSSRSHAIFRIIIESSDINDTGVVNVAHLNLVDLAGSERATLTKATGQRLKEGANINRSLSTLSLVMKQLSEGQEFINFRDSKLTRILQSSLGGNTLTAIICAVTPAALEETHSTLAFASRAKTIKNKPLLNEVVADEALINKYVKEIKRLKRENKDLLGNLQEEKRIRTLENFILISKNVNNSNSISSITSNKYRRKTWSATQDVLPVIYENEIVTSKSTESNIQFSSDDGFSTPCTSKSTSSRSGVALEELEEDKNLNSSHTSKKTEDFIKWLVHSTDTPKSVLRERAEYYEKEFNSLKELTTHEHLLSTKEYTTKIKEMQKELDRLKNELECEKKLRIEQEQRSRKIEIDAKNDSEFMAEMFKEKYKKREQELVNSLSEARKLLESNLQHTSPESASLSSFLDKFKYQLNILKIGVDSDQSITALQTLFTELKVFKDQIPLYCSEDVQDILNDFHSIFKVLSSVFDDTVTIQLEKEKEVLQKQILHFQSKERSYLKLANEQNEKIKQLSDNILKYKEELYSYKYVTYKDPSTSEISLLTDSSFSTISDPTNMRLNLDGNDLSNLLEEKNRTRKKFPNQTTNFAEQVNSLQGELVDLNFACTEKSTQTYFLHKDIFEKSDIDEMERTLKFTISLVRELINLKGKNKELTATLNDKEVEKLCNQIVQYCNEFKTLEELKITRNDKNIQTELQSDVFLLEEKFKEYETNMTNQTKDYCAKLKEKDIEIEGLSDDILNYIDQLTKLEEDIKKLQSVSSVNQEIQTNITMENYIILKKNEYEEDISKYKEQIYKYEAQIAIDKEQISKCQAQIQKNEEKISKNKELFSKCEEQILKYKEQMPKYEEQISKYEAQIRKYEEQNSKYEAQITEYEKQISKYEAQIPKYEEQISKYAAQIPKYEKQISKYEAQISKYKENISECEEQISKYEAQIPKYEEQILKYEAQISKYEKQISKYETDIPKYEEQITKYQAEIPKYKEEISQYKENVSECKEQISKYEAQIPKYEEQIVKYEAQIPKYEKQISKYETDIPKYEEQITKYQAEIPKYKKVISQYKENVSECKEQISKYETQIPKYEKQISKYEAQIPNYEEQISKYEEQITKYQADIPKYEEEISKYNERISECDEQMSKYETRILKYEEQITKYQAEISKYEEQLSKYKKLISECEEKISKYEVQIPKYEEQMRIYQAEIPKYETDLKEKIELVQNKTAYIEKMEKRPFTNGHYEDHHTITSEKQIKNLEEKITKLEDLLQNEKNTNANKDDVIMKKLIMDLESNKQTIKSKEIRIENLHTEIEQLKKQYQDLVLEKTKYFNDCNETKVRMTEFINDLTATKQKNREKIEENEKLLLQISLSLNENERLRKLLTDLKKPNEMIEEIEFNLANQAAEDWVQNLKPKQDISANYLSKIRDLEEQLETCSEKICEYNKQASDSQLKISHQGRELEKCNNFIKQLEIDKKVMDEKCATLVDNYEKQIQILNEKIEKENTYIAELRVRNEEIIHLKQKNEEYRRIVDEVATKANKKILSCNGVIQDYQILTQTNENLKAAIQNEKLAHMQSQNEIASLKEELRMKSNIISITSELQNRICNLEQDNNKLVKIIEANNEDIDKKNYEVQLWKRKSENLKHRVADLQSLYNDAKVQISENTSKLKLLEKEKEIYTKNSRELEEKLEDVKFEVYELRKKEQEKIKKLKRQSLHDTSRSLSNDDQLNIPDENQENVRPQHAVEKQDDVSYHYNQLRQIQQNFTKLQEDYNKMCDKNQELINLCKIRKQKLELLQKEVEKYRCS